MNEAQRAFALKVFTQWVEDTDVAEQCGVTRKEMIESVTFGTPPKRPQIVIRGGDGGTLPGERGGDVNITLDSLEELKAMGNADEMVDPEAGRQQSEPLGGRHENGKPMSD